MRGLEALSSVIAADLVYDEHQLVLAADLVYDEHQLILVVLQLFFV